MSSPLSNPRRWLRRFWLFPPLLLGVALFWFAPRLQKDPVAPAPVERAVKVRTLKVPALKVQPVAVGYGTTRAVQTWEAVAEVAGSVKWLSSEARSGALVQKGQVLLRIDDASYRLNLSQLQAQLEAAQIREQTTWSSLQLAEKDLSLLMADYQRQQSLVNRGISPRNTLETAERQLLGRQGELQNLRNTLALHKAEQEVIAAQRAAAELELARTVLRAPFDLRVTEVKIGPAQYANRGQLLLSADSLEAVEVEARFPVGRLRPLIRSDREALDLAQGVRGLQAQVRLQSSTHQIVWPAQIERVAGVIEASTQSLGVVVRVERPLESAVPGERPPLLRNTFVEVELRADGHQVQPVIPQAALHEGKVFVVDAEQRLELRTVQVQFAQDNYVVLAGGLQPQEQVIVSDLVAAVPGMLLNPQEDPKAKAALLRATGNAKDAKSSPNSQK